MKRNILVIFGGNSAEHDISVITGVEALNALPAKGYRTVPIYIRDGVWYTGSRLFEIKSYLRFDPGQYKQAGLFGGVLYEKKKRGKAEAICRPDCALLATHGGDGENGSLQGLLEMNGIPHTASGVIESAVCMDKAVAKAVLQSAGVRVVEGKSAGASEAVAAFEEFPGYPMIVKPATQGSSIGISTATDRKSLEEAVELAGVYAPRILAERALQGFVEINSGVLFDGKECLVSAPEKPVSAGEFLSFGDKYLGGVKEGGRREFPAAIDDALKAEIAGTSEAVVRALGLFGVVRLDYMIEKGVVYLNEINTIPGSLAHYLFPQWSYGEFLTRLIEAGITRGVPQAPQFPSKVLEGLGEGYRKLK